MTQERPSLTAKANEPQPGQVLASKYELSQVIGRGGFGIVYDAIHLGIGRQIALKVLLPEWAHQDQELAIRFRREAVLASQLRHPNTITLYDYGQTDSGILFMAMEYVDGRTLSTILRDEAPIDPGRVVHILRQILASLQEAHERGIIHRDLKPGNIMLTSHRGDHEFVKVLDFGIAKAISADLLTGDNVSQTLTQAGQFCGTPRYMAPEQFRNGKITPSSDLYSLGLISYELLTGQPAIVGDTMVDLIVAQVAGPSLKLPPELELPQGLRATLERVLLKDSAERFQSAAQLLTALEAWDKTEALFNDDDLFPTTFDGNDSQDQTIDLEPSNALAAMIAQVRSTPAPPAPSTVPVPSGIMPQPDFMDDNGTRVDPERIAGLGTSGANRTPFLQSALAFDELGGDTGELLQDELIEDDDINTEEVPVQQDLDDTTTEMSRKAVEDEASMAQTIDVSRQRVFDEAAAIISPSPPPSRLSGLAPPPQHPSPHAQLPGINFPPGMPEDADATVDMPAHAFHHAHAQDMAQRARISDQAREAARNSGENRALDTQRVKSPQSPAKASKGWGLRIASIVALVLVFGLCAVLVVKGTSYAWNNGLAEMMGRQSSTEPVTNLGAPPNTPTIALNEKASDPITISVLSEPPGASVFVDDKFIAKAPINLSNNKGSAVRLQIKLEDHIGYATELKFRKNRSLSIKLTPAR